MHTPAADSFSARIQGIIRIFYIVVIAGTIAVMLIHNTVDLVYKVRRRRSGAAAADAVKPPAPAATAAELRMDFWERIQHLALFLSFVALAITGFALKYPDFFGFLHTIGMDE